MITIADEGKGRKRSILEKRDATSKRRPEGRATSATETKKRNQPGQLEGDHVMIPGDSEARTIRVIGGGEERTGR